MSINNNVVLAEAVELRTEQDEERNSPSGRPPRRGKRRRNDGRQTWKQALKRDWRLWPNSARAHSKTPGRCRRYRAVFQPFSTASPARFAGSHA